MSERKIYRIPIVRSGQEAKKPVPTPEKDTALADAPSLDRTPAAQDDAFPDVDWRDKVRQLQAEMGSYRSRQEQRADTAIFEDKKRLLRAFLEIMDNFEKALVHLDEDDALHSGVKATYRAMQQLVEQEGVRRIPAVGSRFDPQIHEAVGMLAASRDQAVDLLVVETQRQGYFLADQLLRPARVIVAKKY